ncbi:MAG: SURF1 family protein [Rhodanobacteraceae bacterium]|nr:MAG: SURF1 family protein [Rhodanobacteraceae bacterium]
MVLLACVFGGFIWLGQWQVYRYHLKLRISHALQARVHAAPVPAPGPAEWPRIAAGHLQYLHVSLAGHYLPGKQTLVHGTSPDGYGFWVMTPLQTTRGFIVLVNRGYVPPGLADAPASAKLAPPAGEVALTGLLRSSEPGGGFLRHNQPGKNLWYSRDVAAIAASRDLPADHVAPYFVDAAAAAGDARWPAAGLTKVSIYNHSLGYAITWFVLALGTLLAAGIVVRYERRLDRH